MKAAMHTLLPKPLRAAIACACALAMAGCTLGPDYKRPEAPLPAAFRGDTSNAAADVANTAWWQAFGDPKLDELIKAALAANRDIRLATFNIEAYEARLQVSSSQNYPQVGYQANFDRKRRSEEVPELIRPGAPVKYNEYTVGLTASWEPDLWGRIRRANEASRAELLASEEARHGVMLTVVTAVATTYVQLLGLDQDLALAKQTLKNRKDTVTLLEKKWKGGSATKLTVEQSKSLVEEIETQIPHLERQIATLENAMSTLLARTPGPVPRGSMAALKTIAIPQGVPSDVLQRRPDVTAAEQTLVAANARIGVAKTEYFPTISLTTAFGLASDDLRWLLAKDAKTGDLSRGLVGTIFSAGRIEGDIKEAEAVQRQMVERYRIAIQTALQEVEDALVYRSKSAEQVAAMNRQLASLQEVLRLSKLRFEGGESTYLDVLDAERHVYASQTQLSQGQRDQYLSLVQVYKAMGGGWMMEQDRQRGATQEVSSLQ